MDHKVIQIGFKEFQKRVAEKLKAINPDINKDDLYCSQTTACYYMDYRPKYPEKTAGDFLVCQNLSGVITISGNFNAPIPTIRRFGNIEDFEQNL